MNFYLKLKIWKEKKPRMAERQARETPDNIAICCQDIKISYKGLNEYSTQLAHWIFNNIGTGKRIVVCTEKSIETIKLW